MYVESQPLKAISKRRKTFTYCKKTHYSSQYTRYYVVAVVSFSLYSLSDVCVAGFKFCCLADCSDQEATLEMEAI